MAANAVADNVEQIAVIKYYLDKIEKGSIDHFAYPAYEASGVNVAHALSTLMDLHNKLTTSSPLFRLSALGICSGSTRGGSGVATVSLPEILTTFLSKHLFSSYVRFQEAYPIVSSMLALASRR